MKEITHLIEEEYRRASRLHPPFNSPHEGFAILLEEIDELWEAVKMKECEPNRNLYMYEEAIQIGAMAIRFITDCIENNE
jgi:hypothetical protein